MAYGKSVELDLPFGEAVDRVREVLAEQGFGVLAEIDVASTMKAKLGEEMEDYLILGACNPPLAHRALEADRAVGLLLPCNVVVRRGDAHTIVDVLDPHIISSLTERAEVQQVADEAARRLDAALAALTG